MSADDDDLSALIRHHATRHAAPDGLRASIRTQVALEDARRAPPRAADERPRSGWFNFGWGTASASFALGMLCNLYSLELQLAREQIALTFGKKEQEIFLGREISQHRDYSEHTAIEIDNEVKRLVMENYERAKTIIKTNMKALRAIAEALLERESLEGAEIEQIIQQVAAAPS